MTFLQPSILWALPLVLLPVIIHLINRLRHRPQPWGAMMFLVRANRASTSHAKLRQWLILLFRCLAVLALILFVSRPLAGGWLGWALSPAPDAIVILFDRSASMETLLSDGQTTRREQALKLITQAAATFQDSSQLVMIDSVTREPQQIAGASLLAELPVTRASDTAADMPSLLQAALQWITDTKAGTSEIWIASDLQQSNWQPEDERWQATVQALGKLPQRVRVRLLALGDAATSNTALSLHEALFAASAARELQLAVDVRRSSTQPASVPVTLNLNGAGMQRDLAMDGSVTRWRQRVPVTDAQAAGWGSISLPADANTQDNAAYFVYGTTGSPRALVISKDPSAMRPLALAAMALPDRSPADVIAPADLPGKDLAAYGLIAWHGPMPDTIGGARLQSFAEDGGAVLLMPDEAAGTTRFAGFGWGAVQQAPAASTGFRVTSWNETDGPLARTDEGFNLPVDELAAARRAVIEGDGTVLAAFSDGQPLLVRKATGRGRMFFCATAPQPAWSNLGDGPVLVPMVQRLLQSGAARLNQESMLACGHLSLTDRDRNWTSVDADGKDIRVEAGVYRSGERLVAVNRPATEDEPEALSGEDARKLFSGLSFQWMEESRGRDALQGEVWRYLLFGMLLFLIVEGFLILPAPAPPLSVSTSGKLQTEAARP